MWIEFNSNPASRRGDDCTVRAISKIMNQTWRETYIELCIYGLDFYDMPSSNHVWGAFLKDSGFIRKVIPNTCPHCYTVKQFCTDHPKGRYILALHGHVIAVIDGNYYDTWDSGEEVPLYYWQKGER